MGDEWQWARHHHQRAEEFRMQAGRTETGAIRKQLLQLAAGYERLARDAEATSTANDALAKARAAYRTSKFHK